MEYSPRSLFVCQKSGNVRDRELRVAVGGFHEKQRSSQRKCREHLSNLPSHCDNVTHQGISISQPCYEDKCMEWNKLSCQWWTMELLYTIVDSRVCSRSYIMRNRDPPRENVENIFAICLPAMTMQHISEYRYFLLASCSYYNDTSG